MSKVNSKKKVTIKDVANDANASTSTVSMVVNGKGYVSEEKKSDIMNSIRKLGYVPSTSARNLASNKTNNIGFILQESHFSRSEPFYTRIFLGTEFESKKHNYYVLLETVPENYSKSDNTPRLLRERNVDGIIIAGKVSHELLEQVEGSGLPFVLVDYRYKSYTSVMADNLNAGIEAVRYMIEKGHTKIAFLGADIEHPSIASRLEGYQLAMMKHGITHIEDLIFVDENMPPSMQTGVKLGKLMMQSQIKPTAAFCANDAIAMGLLKFAEKENINIPKDLNVIGFDDVEGAKFSLPPLTTVRVFKEQIGELALKHLAELISSTPESESKFDRNNQMITVPTELVIRQTA